MTARDDLAVLFERRIIGEEPGTTNYDSALRQAVADLDAIASLARDPATAPAVFAWLVEAGVLRVPDLTTRCHHGTPRFGWTSGKNPTTYSMPCVQCSMDAIEAAPEEAASSEGRSPFAVGDTEPSSSQP